MHINHRTNARKGTVMLRKLSAFDPEYSELRPGYLAADVDLTYPEKTGNARVTASPGE